MEAIVSQLMEKQRLARSGGGGGVAAVPAANPSNAPPPQRHHHQAGGGRNSNRSSVEPVQHHKAVADTSSSLNDLAAGHSLPHSHRRISNGGGGNGPAGNSFIRLEPRPAPPHSNAINSQVMSHKVANDTFSVIFILYNHYLHKK